MLWRLEEKTVSFEPTSLRSVVFHFFSLQNYSARRSKAGAGDNDDEEDADEEDEEVDEIYATIGSPAVSPRVSLTNDQLYTEVCVPWKEGEACSKPVTRKTSSGLLAVALGSARGANDPEESASSIKAARTMLSDKTRKGEKPLANETEGLGPRSASLPETVKESKQQRKKREKKEKKEEKKRRQMESKAAVKAMQTTDMLVQASNCLSNIVLRKLEGDTHAPQHTSNRNAVLAASESDQDSCSGREGSVSDDSRSISLRLDSSKSPCSPSMFSSGIESLSSCSEQVIFDRPAPLPDELAGGQLTARLSSGSCSSIPLETTACKKAQLPVAVMVTGDTVECSPPSPNPVSGSCNRSGQLRSY